MRSERLFADHAGQAEEDYIFWIVDGRCLRRQGNDICKHVDDD